MFHGSQSTQDAIRGGQFSDIAEPKVEEHKVHENFDIDIKLIEIKEFQM